MDFWFSFYLAGLPEFLQNVTNTFYKLQPYIVLQSGQQKEFIKRIFRPYNPTPESVKKITTGSQELLKELKGLKFDRRRLTMREDRTLAKIEHYLQHFFGEPYVNNYYSGTTIKHQFDYLSIYSREASY